MDERLKPVVIVGAGPVGAVCALAMQQQGVDVQVLEAQSNHSRTDTRTLALAYGARLILDRLGVWDRLEDVTPITRIHISQRGGLGVARLAADALRIPALGYVMSYAMLAQALQNALSEARIAVEYGVEVSSIDSSARQATLRGLDGTTRNAALVVVADGGRSEMAPDPKIARDYEQIAVVCEVQTELPHANQAYERFTPEGPAALLPKGERYALVWTAEHDDAERIAALSDHDFLAAIYRHFGGRQGRFLSATPRKTFPLKLAYTGRAIEERLVRIGNAAQTLHPVAGQGFNIGLRDAWELASLCGESAANELGSAIMLDSYSRGRRLDVLGGVGFTDFLVRVFSNDFAPLRHARGLGLLALEAFPPLKSFVARRMIFGSRG